jgi:chemotaxis protein methyltransferase WspC
LLDECYVFSLDHPSTLFPLPVYDTIAQLLQQRMGLMPDSIGQRTINRIIDQCMAEKHLTDVQVYLRQLQTNEIVLQELIEAIVVPETWFMRDRAPFDFLLSQIRQTPSGRDRLLSSQRPLRILSMPCSTGEEPYSIAMTLLEAGLNPSEFSVDGMDISHVSLARARVARYRDYSFRNQPTEIRDRYFDPIDNLYQLQKRVCDQVTFTQGNILEQSWINPQRPYHVIFCRNLLIYLNGESRRQVFDNLETALATDGILFLGSTESTQPVPPPMKAMRHKGTFFYHKQGVQNHELATRSGPRMVPRSARPDPLPSHTATRPIDRPRPVPSLPRSTRSSRPTSASVSAPITAPSTEPISTPRSAPNDNPELDGLRRLADAGLIDEAIESCEYYLRGHSSDAEGHLLLGELYQAQQLNSRAEDCYRRATYLKPDHRQALIHLALLKEQQGDSSGANLFWRRIDRLESGSS